MCFIGCFAMAVGDDQCKESVGSTAATTPATVSTTAPTTTAPPATSVGNYLTG